MSNDEYEGEPSEPELDIPEECYDPDTWEISEERVKIYLENKKRLEKENQKILDKETVKEAFREVKKEDEGKDKEKNDDNEYIKEEKVDERKLLSYLNDMPRNNLIIKYIDTISLMTSAYPEWHFAMIVSILSNISARKLKISMRHKVIYPNIWFFLLGLSTVAQKTTAFELAEEVVNKVSSELGSKEMVTSRLPGSFSPEGFGDSLNECNGLGFLWKDEVGDLLKSMEKDYMSNMRDLLCDLYGCKTFHRKLKKEVIYVETPFVNMTLATTPDTFKEYANVNDLTSGWLYRYIYLYPEYDKNWMALGQRSEKDHKQISDLVLLLKIKVEAISRIQKGNEINFTFESGCLEFYEKWSERMYYKAQKGRNQIEAAFIGRLEDYVLKLATIFTFGESTFKTEISKKTMEMTCQLVENYFLPMALKVADMVRSTKNNIIEKVLDIIKTNGGKIDRSNLLRKSRLKARELDDVCLTLMESEEVNVYTKNRIKWYELTKIPAIGLKTGILFK